MYNPNNLYGMKTPEQYQQEIQQQYQQYQNAYNQMKNYNQFPAQQISNGGVFYYIKNFEEVEKAQVNMNGNAELFIGDGIMWSKKLVNGQPYIDAFAFTRINNGGDHRKRGVDERKQENNINIQMTTNDLYNAFMEEIGNIKKRIENLENRKIEKAEVIDNVNE